MDESQVTPLLSPLQAIFSARRRVQVPRLTRSGSGLAGLPSQSTWSEVLCQSDDKLFNLIKQNREEDGGDVA